MIAIITTAFVWLVSVAESIIFSFFSFFATLLIFWTLTMAGNITDEDGKVLYCETLNSGVEVCERKEWSIVD